MSRVFLHPYYSVSSNNNPHKIELSEKMLLWPFRRSNDINDEFPTEDQKKYKKTYNKMLRALMTLGLFDSDIFLQVDPEKQIIYPSYWCSIYILLDDRIVFKFDPCLSDDKLFHTIFDWPKTDDFQEIEKWTPNKWRSFFLNRIMEKAVNDLKEANHKAREATLDLNIQIKATQEIAHTVDLAKGVTRV